MNSFVTIGRSSSCDIILSDMNISREHARISIVGGKYVFENVGRHGSYMNGRLIGNEKIVVAPGTEILLANRVPLPWSQVQTLLPLSGIVVNNQPEETTQYSVPSSPAVNYQSPSPQPQVEEKRTNGMGIAGFVLSIIALVVSCIPFFNIIMAFLGLLFSFIAVFRKPRGFAIAGLIISGIAGILISVFYFTLAEVVDSTYYYY